MTRPVEYFCSCSGMVCCALPAIYCSLALPARRLGARDARSGCPRRALASTDGCPRAAAAFRLAFAYGERSR